MQDCITLDHGSGGGKTAELIESVFLSAYGSEPLESLGDGAILPGAETLVCSTDSFVISPCFFPGGDVGKLSVCGTVNDVCMAGGKPLYLSVAMILEEGFPLDDLRRIAASIAKTAKSCGVRVVTGDTKVVERGHGDGIYINTTGIGALRHAGLGPSAIREGDAVLLSGTAGDHGTAVMLCRQELGLESGIQSDCAPLCGLCEALLPLGEGLRVLRDPTRGGVATTLCEFVEGSELCIELNETDIPIRADVKNGCELLGLDPLYCANEGKLLAVVAPECEEEALHALQSAPDGLGKNAAVIGHVSRRGAGRVLLNTRIGGTRVLTKLQGAQLPRIC